MENFIDYLSTLWPFMPLLFFIIAITFRLMDNSASLFLQKDIMISSSNVSRKLLRQQIAKHSDPDFTKKLKRLLVLRDFQKGFLIIAVLSIPISFLGFFLA